MVNQSTFKAPESYLWSSNSTLVSFSDTTASDPDLLIGDLQTAQDSTISLRLEVTSADGCVDDTLIDIVVYSRPQANFSMIPNSCGPYLLSPADSSTGNTLSYQWSITPLPAGNHTGLNTSTPVFDLPVSTNDSIRYIVRLEITDSRGCQDTLSKPFTIYPKPAALFSLSINDSCGTFSPAITNNSLPNQSGQSLADLSFLWDLGNGDTSSLPEPGPSYPAALQNDTSYLISLIATNTFGCSDTLTDSITVYPNPISQLAPNATVDCAPFVLDSSIVQPILYPNANDNYLWEIRSADTSTVLTSFNGPYNLNYTILNDGDSVILRLITSNSHGCKQDTLDQLFYTIENPQPGFVLDTNAGCHPLTVQVTDTSTQGVTHQWFLDGTLISNAQNPTLTLTNSSNTNDATYQLKLVITAGATGCKDSVEQTITVYPKPKAIIELNIGSSCAPDSIPIRSISNVKAPDRIKWSANSTLIQFVNDSVQDAVFYFPDWHTGSDTNVTLELAIVSADGCTHDTAIDFTILSRPIAWFNLPTSDCAPIAIGPLDSSISAGNNLAYDWNIQPLVQASNLNTSSPIFQIPATFQDSQRYRIQLLVTDDRGCVDTLSKFYTSYPRPTASFNMLPGDSCGPLSVFFNNTSNSGQSGMNLNSMSFLWDFGNGATDTARFPEPSFSPDPTKDTTYTIQLISTNAFGCSDTAIRDIIIFPDPIASYTALTQAECAPFKIDSNIINVAQYPLANDFYEWQVFDLVNQSILSSATGIPNIDYTITGDNDSVGIRLISSNTHGCRPDTLSLIFRTLPDPVASFGLSVYSGCHPLSVQTIDSSTVGVSHEWFVNGVLSSTQQNPGFTLTNPSLKNDSTYFIELVVTAGTGCTDTVKDSVLVFALPDPIYGATEVCLGESIVFTDSSTSVGGLASWKWRFGDGDSSLLSSPSHLYDSAGVYYAELTVTDNRGCSQSFGDSVVVRPNPLSLFDLLHSCFPDSVCVNDVLDLNDSSTVASLGQPVDQWEWDIDADGNIEYATQFAQHTFTTTGARDIALYVETQYGCKDTLIKRVNVVETPTAQFSLDTNQGCGPLNVSVTNESSGYIRTYSWRFFAKDGAGNDVVLSTDTLFDPNPVPAFIQSYLQDTTYYLELTVGNCCGSDTYLDSVIVFANPVADFLAVPDSGCSPLPVMFMLDGLVKGEPDYLSMSWGDGSATDTINWQWLIQPTGDTLWYWGQQNHNFTYFGRQADTTYFVTLTAHSDCGDSSITKPIVVRPNTVQAFFQALPAAGCAPLTVNFSDFSFGGNNITWCFEYDLASANCGPFTAAGPNATHTYVKGGTYSVAQIVDDGCSVDTAFQQIVVYPAPTADFQYAHAGCVSDSVSFTNASTVDSGSISQYIWYFGDGDSSLNTTPSHLYSAGGRYQICLQVRTNYGCVDEYCDSIIVNDDPFVQFTGQDLCFNEQPVVFTNNSNPGSGNLTSTLWDFGDGNTSTLFQPTHSFAQAGTYTVRLYHENNFGCQDSAVLPVSIYPVPTASFDAQLIAGDSCSVPRTYQFNDQSSGAQGFLWDFDAQNNPGQWTSTLRNPQFTYTSTGSYQVQLITTNSQGCGDTTLQTIEVLPVPQVFILSDKVSDCAPLTVQFRDSLVSNWPTPIPIQSYTWRFGDGSSSNLQFPIHTYTQPGNYTVTLVIETALGCKDSLSLADLIQVSETPYPSFDIVQTIGSTFQFYNTSTRVYPNSSYTWSFGDGNGSTQTDPLHDYGVDLYDQNYQFYVCLNIENANGCDSTICDSVDIIGYRLNVPNALAPEMEYADYQDAVHFLPKGVGLRSYELEIFDGWGNRVFRTTELDADGIPAVAWNGRRNNEGDILPMGAYVWSIKAVFDNGMHWRGKTYDSGRRSTYGTVTLIR